MITKDEFIDAIDEIIFVDSFHNDLNAFLSSKAMAPYFDYPDCQEVCISLLQNMFGDVEEIITWYCLDGGRTEKQFKRENGEYIKIDNAEQLYTYLTRDK